MVRARRTPSREVPSLLFLPFAILFLAQSIGGLLNNAPVGDEVLDLADGYYYWKGDLVSNNGHPPLFKALAALPLCFTSAPKPAGAHPPRTFEQRARGFFFQRNQDRFQSLVVQGRWVSLLFGLGVGWLLFLCTRSRSRVLAASVLALWAFEPNLLAYSGLALADLPLTFFYLLSVLLAARYLESPSKKGAVGLSAAMAGAVTVKFSAVVLGPVLLALWLLGRRPRVPWDHLRTGLGTFLLLIGLVYLPGTLVPPDHRLPWSYFWDGFLKMASYSGHPTYFLGKLSEKGHWAYYPVVLLLKTPLSLLALTGLAAFLGWRKDLRLPAFHWVPGLLFFACLAPFHNLGSRLILPCYPFLVLCAGAGVERLWSWKTRQAPNLGKLLASVFLLAQALSVGLSPRHLSYFNELVAPKDRIQWLGDCNLDIGQESKLLADTAKKEGWGKVKLAYFGATDPALYGMQWERWTPEDLKGPQPGFLYAVNAGFLQLGPVYLPWARAVVQSWVVHRPPTRRLGDTWLIYEAPAGH